MKEEPIILADIPHQSKKEAYQMANRIILNTVSFHGKGAIGEIPRIAKSKGFTGSRPIRPEMI